MKSGLIEILLMPGESEPLTIAISSLSGLYVGNRDTRCIVPLINVYFVRHNAIAKISNIRYKYVFID